MDPVRSFQENLVALALLLASSPAGGPPHPGADDPSTTRGRGQDALQQAGSRGFAGRGA